MSFLSQKKNHSVAPTSSQVPQQPTNSQSQSQSTQEEQQSQPVGPWSAHAPPSGQSPSPFLRNSYTLSTSATAVGELFLFGGFIHTASFKSPSNDLYVFSIRDFSATLLQTSGDVPGPRYGHCAVLASTTLLIWGGAGRRATNHGNQKAPLECNDNSFYLLNLASREWTRIAVNGLGPGDRCYHTMTLVDSKLFLFGGWSFKEFFNDIWILDLNCLKSNPFWKSYEPAPGNEKPLPRAGHISVTTGDRIVIFGGCYDQRVFNDTWSFHISTRKWTKLQCTGSIPCPRRLHAAVLIDDFIYVFGGYAADKTSLGDLTALNLSTQRWTAFQDMGPSPSGREGHAMACDGTRVFVLGGRLSPGAQVSEAKPIHILDTKLLVTKPDSNTVKQNEKTTELAQKLSVGRPTQGQPQQSTLSSSNSDVHAEHGTSPVQKATGELKHFASLQIAQDRTAGPPGLNDKPRHVLVRDDYREGSTVHSAKLVAPNAPEKEAAQLEHERIADLERQLSETLAERARLTDQLAHKSVLLEQVEANAAEVRKRTGLEQRDHQAKLDELLLSRDQARSALRGVAEVNERSERELAEVHAKLEARESELAAVRLRLMDAEVGWAKSKAEAETLRAGTQAAADLVNVDVERVMRRLMERVRSVEAEMASLQGNEKSIGEMECRNEG